MQKLTLVLFALVVVISAQAQKKETRQVGSFESISLGISADLIISQGNSNSLTLEGSTDDLNKIETYVSDGKLKIKNENNSWFGNDMNDVKIYVTVVNFTGASVSGSGNITNSNNLKGDNINLSVSGSGEIKIYIDCKSVDAHISGSGEIALTGNANALQLSISGSGEFNSLEMPTNTLEAHISGSGAAKVNVKDEIDAHISGSGRIRYSGNPLKIREKISGSGSVKSL